MYQAFRLPLLLFFLLVWIENRFIFSLGVQLVGARMAEAVAEEFDGDFEAFWGALTRYATEEWNVWYGSFSISSLSSFRRVTSVPGRLRTIMHASDR